MVKRAVERGILFEGGGGWGVLADMGPWGRKCEDALTAIWPGLGHA